MANPKRRHSRSRRNNRRAHYHMKAPNVIPCPHCGEPKLSHRACPECGRYGEVMVKKVKE